MTDLTPYYDYTNNKVRMDNCPTADALIALNEAIRYNMKNLVAGTSISDLADKQKTLEKIVNECQYKRVKSIKDENALSDQMSVNAQKRYERYIVGILLIVVILTGLIAIMFQFTQVKSMTAGITKAVYDRTVSATSSLVPASSSLFSSVATKK